MDDICEVFHLARLLEEKEHVSEDNVSDDGYEDDQNIELELRFKFVDKNRFIRLYEYAKENFRTVEEYSYIENRIQLVGESKSVHREVIREDGKKIVESKTSIKTVHTTDMWIDIVVSIEKKMTSMRKVFTKSKNKKRTSFEIIADKMRLDLTSNEEDDIYQIELEILDIYSDADEVMNIANNMILEMLDSTLYIKKALYDCMVNIASKRYYFSDTEYFCISEKKYQTPKTLKIEEFSKIFEEPFYITPKLDGQRRFLILVNNKCYSIDSILQVRKELDNISYDASTICILDCEYMDEFYNIIDVVILYGEYIGNIGGPIERLEDLRHSGIGYNYNIRIKEYEILDDRPSSIYDRIISWKDKYNMDGVVLVNSKYIGECLKVKFEVTVDLYFDEDGDFVSSDSIILSKDIIIENADKLIQNRVYELIVVSENVLRVLRSREDKPIPNSSYVIRTNMSSDVAMMEIFKGKHSIMMRKMHNKVKRLMYMMCNTTNSTILDIGTGQGGDISKWKGCKNIFAIEPDKDVSRELYRRIRQSKTRIPISHIQCRTESYRKIIKTIGNNRINIISMFFCLNLFSDDDLNGMYNIINGCASNKCKIIGSYMDITSFGSNSCYELIDLGNNTYSIDLKGTRIRHIERIVNFDDIRSRLERSGFTLTFRSRMNKMNHNLSNEEILLTNMFYSFEFRRGRSTWTKRRDHNINISEIGVGKIVIDNNYNVLSIEDPKYDNKSYYFEMNGMLLNDKATDEEIQMATIRL